MVPISSSRLLIGFGAIFLVTAGLRAWAAPTQVTNVDEGAYLSSALLMGRGAVLYKDIITNKPPGLYLLLDGLFRTVGPSRAAGRWAVIVAGSISAVLIAAIALRIMPPAVPGAGPVAALGAGLFFAVDPFAVFWGRQVMTDGFAIFAALLAIWLALVALQSPKWRWWFISGAALAASAAFKQTGILAALPVGLLILLTSASWRQKGKYITLVAGGALATAALLTAWAIVAGIPFAAMSQQVWGINVGANLGTDDVVSRLRALALLYVGHRVIGPFVLLAPLVLANSLRRQSRLGRGQWPLWGPLIAWFGIEIAFVLTAKNFGTGYSGYSHYHPSFLPALSLIAGFGVTFVWQAAAQRAWRPLMAAAVILAAWSAWASTPTWEALHRALVIPPFPAATLAQEQEVAREVAARANGSAVYSFAHPGLYFWSGLPPASPFLEPNRLYREGMSDAYFSSVGGMLAEGRAVLVVTTKSKESLLYPQEAQPLYANYEIVWPHPEGLTETYEGFRIWEYQP